MTEKNYVVVLQSTLVRDTLGLELIEGSRINALGEERRQKGKYSS